MTKKIILIVLLYTSLFLFAGNSLWAVIFFLSVPALAYALIKIFIIEAPGNFVGNLLFGEKTCTNPVKEISRLRILLLNHQYEHALNLIDSLEEQNLEIKSLKMKILYEHFKDYNKAIKVGLELLKSRKYTHQHCTVLAMCIEIYIESNNFNSARQLLNAYGPKMPSSVVLNDKMKRLNALQAS